ncbi:MAG: phage antirepressor KilAC domain-containing protein [Gemella sp.]|nr:phage antirepressor KilAC domain-containing protein [Gemella sp.]
MKNEFEEEINEGKISAVEYKDKKGESRPMFNLTLSQAKQVLVRESKAVRKAVIKYIEELENKLKLPSTYKEALISLVNQIEENEQLQLTVAVQKQQLQELQPKATYYELVLQNESLISITKIAKDFGLSGKKLNQILKNKKVQYKQGNTWLLYSEHSDKGYTHSKTSDVNGGRKSVLHTYWTQKGRLFIYELLKGMGIKPVVER